MRNIYLVRHGIPDFPDGKIVIQGRYTDLNLNPNCFHDAANLASFFEDKEIENWYSSPLKRAYQTLEQFLPRNKSITILENAVEVCYGRWEGKSWAENRVTDPLLFQLRENDNTVLPEDAEDMKLAAKRMYEAVLETKGNCVIACHWTVISLVYCLISGFPYEKYMQIPHPYLGVTKIVENDEIFTVDYVGKKVCETPFCDKFTYC